MARTLIKRLRRNRCLTLINPTKSTKLTRIATPKVDKIVDNFSNLKNFLYQSYLTSKRNQINYKSATNLENIFKTLGNPASKIEAKKKLT